MSEHREAMDFRIADTFTDSLARLTADEQKAVKTTAFDLQMNPAQPGMQFHKLDRAKDSNFWSVRVSKDIRLIVHRTSTSLMLCYVDHHDAAYSWAERRKIGRHPTTGAAQLVEIRETVRDIVIPRYVEAAAPAATPKFLFTEVPEWLLLTYGVPPEWMDDVRAASEETLFDLAEHLPREAAEALLDLAVGVKPAVGPAVPPQLDAFEHPDAQRRFRVIANVEELERALNAPWEKWVVFLHPAQRHLAERDFNGPARVFGSAGTGKTIVALHRAVHLARANPDSRVLLTTFSDTLANSLRSRVRLLIANEPRIGERLEVQSMGAIGRRLHEAQIGPVRVPVRKEIEAVLRAACVSVQGLKFTPHFLWTEWSSVVDAWQMKTWEEYRDIKRLGRRTRLSEAQRATLWSVFEQMNARLSDDGLATESALFMRLAEKVAAARRPVFNFVVVDEAQDVSIAQLRFLRALGGDRLNGLFFAGDLGQRIFQQPFSWKSLGVNVQGRSARLRINYRTSHQIRKQADRLLAPELSDVDGLTEDRRGTISAFNGTAPEIGLYDGEQAEGAAVVKWITARLAEGLRPQEIALFVRSNEQLDRAKFAVESAGVPYVVLDEKIETRHSHLAITTMHLAKGLEFRAVAVMACDEDILPLQSRIESAADESDLDDIYQTERHLLYVACTRARDSLLMTGRRPGSEFLADLS
jgi:mRNA-degrading endonuclease RelE of RelBE toxin-antitoxin system